MNFIYNMILTVKVYDGEGEKKPRNEKDETNEKDFPRLVALPSPLYKIGGRLFSGVKEPKTSRTYPRWDRNPNLYG